MRFTLLSLSLASALLASTAAPVFALPLRSTGMSSSTPMRRDASSRSAPAVATWLDKRMPGSGDRFPGARPVEATAHVYTPDVPDAVGGFTSGEELPEELPEGVLSTYRQAVVDNHLSAEAFEAIKQMLAVGVKGRAIR